MNTIPELIEASHAMAVAKGWWPTEGRSVVEIVNCLHSEISEAWEEYRHGRMEVWYSPRSDKRPEYRDKPEGFWVEIADLCIRLADTMGEYGWYERPWYPEADSNVRLPRLIGELHRTLDRMVIGCWGDRWGSDAGCTASSILHYCVEHAKRNGVDLWTIIREKMAFNSTRPARHGGLKA